MFGELSLHFDTILLLGMVLAFVFNFFFFCLKLTQNTSLLITSGVMAASYFLSNHFFDVVFSSEFRYFFWFTFDVLTIVLIGWGHWYFKLKHSVAYFYVMFGLAANGSLLLAMHVDTYMIGTREVWWFWPFYSASINFFDLLMVVVLILNRDVLLLLRFCHQIKGSTKTSMVSTK